MNADMQRPHDKLFRSVFTNPHEAASFLLKANQATLHADVTALFIDARAAQQTE